MGRKELIDAAMADPAVARAWYDDDPFPVLVGRVLDVVSGHIAAELDGYGEGILSTAATLVRSMARAE